MGGEKAMQVSFRHSNYRATLKHPSTNNKLIDDLFEAKDLLPSNLPILKCASCKAIIRPSLVDDSNFHNDDFPDEEEHADFDGDDDELTEFDGDDEEHAEFDGNDEELVFFDEENDELTVFDGENITSYENDADPGGSTILDEERSAPDLLLTVPANNPSDNVNRSTSTFYWQNPFLSQSFFQKCSYWTK